MLAKCPSTKPLYKLERHLDYNKHKQKLKNIVAKSATGKLVTGQTDRSLDQRPWVKDRLKNQLERSSRAIEQQNQKLLSKLMKISTRNSSQKGQGIKHRQNLYRRNWLNNIRKENEQFGEKLIHLRCSLEYSRFSKSIGEYEKVKKSMKINRRPRLPELQINLKNNTKKVLKKEEDRETIAIKQQITKTEMSEDSEMNGKYIKLIKTEVDEDPEMRYN